MPKVSLPHPVLPSPWRGGRRLVLRSSRSPFFPIKKPATDPATPGRDIKHNQHADAKEQKKEGLPSSRVMAPKSPAKKRGGPVARPRSRPPISGLRGALPQTNKGRSFEGLVSRVAVRGWRVRIVKSSRLAVRVVMIDSGPTVLLGQ